MSSRLLFFSIAFLYVGYVIGQSTNVVIDDILIIGNKKTKNYIINRELTFAEKDTLPIIELAEAIPQSERNLLNTQLFNYVSINIIDWNTQKNRVVIEIEVREAWYIFPAPIFELADRNFNVWWVEQNRALNRINLGVRLKYRNFSGNADELKTTIQFGYTQKYEVNYLYPYINHGLTLGLEGNLLYAQNRELAFQSLNNKLVFHRNDDEILFQRFRAKVGLKYRPNIFATHIFRIEHHRNSVAASVADQLNAEYFGRGRTNLQFHVLEYEFEYDEHDLRIYPQDGFALKTKIRRQGLLPGDDIHNWVFRAEGDRFFRFSPYFSLGTYAVGQLATDKSQLNYYQYRALGYDNDFVRGYEYYVIDGKAFLLWKNKLKWMIYNRDVDIARWVPLKSMKEMPFRLYVTGGFDTGYVQDPLFADNNPLTNQWLFGQTLGLDMLVYNNFVYTVELSRNHLDEYGVYLHFNVRL
ncbi:MAG TPA: BamA/TamA family outer membrane protein [Saprospiraceae bacterium]|nr:BamA/TamA family outer membrane protein [Saprospiraceae bacterium]MCB9270623.1 BamA/TamA family outer membrane protein [Lewinellaceae bacterium]HPG06007.1 BamA/TamA family outer membrane protein [Saprospiraceae bacterium]HPR00014.1 BamA/TamA family outer membrane protein [Saprospiraceae bacterium]HQU51586.1 BamA/TamA family outer membrane protein [Saprospiraceae bacterium]